MAPARCLPHAPRPQVFCIVGRLVFHGNTTQWQLVFAGAGCRRCHVMLLLGSIAASIHNPAFVSSKYPHASCRLRLSSHHVRNMRLSRTRPLLPVSHSVSASHSGPCHAVQLLGGFVPPCMIVASTVRQHCCLQLLLLETGPPSVLGYA
jgi:hypothetical protein